MKDRPPRVPRPRVEVLEDRCVPAGFGQPWPNTALTVSFVPDGTEAGPTQSDLFGLLDAQYGSTEDWQRQFLLAFQTWLQHVDLDVGVVADSGDALGTTGVIQGDTRFGDVRLAAYAMTPEAMAMASPFDLLSGTWAGDLKLNSTWFGEGSTVDLYSVLLHEIGHVLGLDHSDDPASPLYEDYYGNLALLPEDILRLQELYGERQADDFDALRPNDTLADATLLPPAGEVTADLTTAGDLDWYRFDLTGQERTATIRLDTAGLSLLSGRLSVYDEDGRLVTTVLAGDRPGQDLEVTVHREGRRGTFYVCVDNDGADFAVGGYRLTVTADSANPAPQQNPATHVGTPVGDSPVVNLQQRVHRTDARFDHALVAGFAAAGETDWYRFVAPAPTDGVRVLTVMVWGLEGDAQPRLTLYDAEGNRLEVDALVSQDGAFVFQLDTADLQGTFLLEVSNAGGAGDYFLGVDFGLRAVALETLAAGTINGDPATSVAGSGDGGTLVVNETRLFHLVFTAGESGSTESVRLELQDAAGSVLASLEAAGGETVTLTKLLEPGVYAVRFTSEPATDVAGSPDDGVAYQLRVAVLDDPIGPALVDTTLAPRPSSPPTFFWQTGFHGFLGGSAPPAPAPAPAPPAADAPRSPGDPATDVGSPVGSATTTTGPALPVPGLPADTAPVMGGVGGALAPLAAPAAGAATDLGTSRIRVDAPGDSVVSPVPPAAEGVPVRLPGGSVLPGSSILSPVVPVVAPPATSEPDGASPDVVPDTTTSVASPTTVAAPRPPAVAVADSLVLVTKQRSTGTSPVVAETAVTAGIGESGTGSVVEAAYEAAGYPETAVPDGTTAPVGDDLSEGAEEVVAVDRLTGHFLPWLLAVPLAVALAHKQQSAVSSQRSARRKQPRAAR